MYFVKFPEKLKHCFLNGNVFAYPTEAVFGLGCDPANQNAIMQLLKLKDRPIHKGLILIANNIEQLKAYADFSALTEHRIKEIEASWPGPNTWLVPKNKHTPEFLSGKSELIAVRVTAHPVVKEICNLVGSAIVSTSANLNGKTPAKSCGEVVQQFGEALFCVDGELGGLKNPSQIRNALTGEVVRAA